MKNTLILFVWTAAIVASCNDQQKRANDGDASNKFSECYAHQTELDTVILRMNTANGKVTGELVYKLYEKDKNRGSFEGQFRGDTLLANYVFQSEGTESMRQVAFLKKGTDYVEGFGDIEEKQGVTTFRDPSKLNFESNIILKRVDCK